MAGERMLSTGQTEKRLGISVRRIYRWEAAGRLVPISRLPSGQRRFSSRDIDALLRSRVRGKERCAVYARVSSEKQAEAGNLGRQKDRLVARPRDTRSRPQWQSGRPARFGFAYSVEAFAGSGSRSWTGRWRWMRPEELVADMLAIVTCCAARLYGSRSQQFRQKVKAAAKEAEGLAG